MGSSVLVVEDESDIREVFVRVLRGGGFEVDDFADPEKALAACQIKNYDLLLLDIMMPRMDGIDLAHRINAGEHKAPVVFVSAHSLNRLVDRAARVSGASYLVKPVMPRQLLSAVSLALGLPEVSPRRAAGVAKRLVVERAKGILIERHRILDHMAFRRLREMSQNSGLSQFETAEQIVRGAEMLAEKLGPK